MVGAIRRKRCVQLRFTSLGRSRVRSFRSKVVQLAESTLSAVGLGLGLVCLGFERRTQGGAEDGLGFQRHRIDDWERVGLCWVAADAAGTPMTLPGNAPAVPTCGRNGLEW